MESIALSCKIREARGKGQNRRLRNSNRLPANVYGHGLSEAVAIDLDPKEFEKVALSAKGYNSLVALELNGATRYGFVRDVQRRPSTRSILHVDVVLPDLDKPMVAEVPVKLSGRSIGVATGGKLYQPNRTVHVKARPADIPAAVAIDVTPMNHNETVMASNMPLPEGVTPVYDHDFIVVKILAPRGAESQAPQA